MKLLAFGCVMALAMAGTAAAKSDVVVVRDYAAVANCKALGEVRGSSMMGGILANAAYGKSLRLLKERTAALGGTHVQILDSASGFSGSRMIGAAYRCDAAPSAQLANAQPDQRVVQQPTNGVGS